MNEYTDPKRLPVDEATLMRTLGTPETRLAGQPRTRPAHDLSGWAIALLFVLLAGIAAIPIFSYQLPPMTDYVNHLSRMHVIATVKSDPFLSRFYDIEWALIPNLMMDMIVPPLTKLTGVYLAGQLYTYGTFVLILSGTLALNRALFGHWSVLPLIAFPLLYNSVFLIGVMNYLFGIGLTLWGLAAWIWLRDRASPLRFAASTAFVVALYFCHLFAVGLYGIGLLAFELRRLWKSRDRSWAARIGAFVACGVPFLPVGPMLYFSPTWRLKAENYWEPRGKIDGIVYVIEVYSDVVAFGLAAIVVAAGVWAIRHKLLRFHSLAGTLVVVAGLVYLAMPRVLFGTYLADQRLPIALAFMLVACVHLELRHRLVRRGFVAMLFLLLAIRVAEVQVNYGQLSTGVTSFRESVKDIDRGSTVLVAYADRSGGDDVRDYGLVHAACLAIIERSALVTTAFTVPGKQILRVKPQYRDQVDTEDGTPPTIYQLLAPEGERDPDEAPAYWHNWEKNFDYLYLLFTETDAANPDPERLTLVHENGRFQLYRINKDP